MSWLVGSISKRYVWTLNIITEAQRKGSEQSVTILQPFS